ncbi:hypothetical protein VPH35_125675 [Triticum aestivum]
MEAYVPVREPRGPAGPHGALVPVRLDPFVPVPGTNRDQWSSLLAHSHWSWFVAGTGTKGPPRIGTNEVSTPATRALHTTLFFLAGKGRALWCPSSPPMHIRCSMKCPSHTS